MLKRIGAGVAVLAITALTLLVAPAAAQAATPTATVQEQECLTPPKLETADLDKGLITRFEIPCRQVTFVDKCDGSTATTFTNANDSEETLPAEFFVGAQGWTVEGGQSITVNLPKSDELIEVFTRYPSPNGPKSFLIDHNWERPDGCWKVSVGSLCDKQLAVALDNTAVVSGTATVQPDTQDAVDVLVAANSTFTSTYAAETVTITVDGKTSTYNWKQPVCTTPTPPATTAPPVGRDTSNDLPATGSQAAASDLRWGTYALGVALTGAVGIGVLWAVRRSRRQNSPQS